jgi:hypothetical protein
VQFVSPSLFGPINPGSNGGNKATTTDATVSLRPGSLKPLPSDLLSSGQSETPTLGDVFSHEMGGVYSRWFGGGADSDGYSVRLENETRKLNGEPTRLGHQEPGDVDLTKPTLPQ